MDHSDNHGLHMAICAVVHEGHQVFPLQLGNLRSGDRCSSYKSWQDPLPQEHPRVVNELRSSKFSSLSKMHLFYVLRREYDVREQIFHTWPTGNDNIFNSNFSTRSRGKLFIKCNPIGPSRGHSNWGRGVDVENNPTAWREIKENIENKLSQGTGINSPTSYSLGSNNEFI